jgi:hypothetical protein
LERILSLDISTKTGYSVLESHDDGNFALLAFGQIKQIPMPEGQYPAQFVEWAHECFRFIIELIDRHAPDCLVIEETASGSKSIYSQKILEFCHYLVAKFIKDTKIKAVYLKTEEWRRQTSCLISKEESKRNKTVREYKKKHGTNIAYDENGKRIGKITRKHVNVRRANELFNLELIKAQDDIADAILLGYAYHLKKNENQK